MSFIAKTKEFFKRKKADAKFSTAGPGYTLKDEAHKAHASSSSSSASVAPPRQAAGPTAAQQAAAEAALRRMQQEKQRTAPKPRTLENILEDERRRASQEARERDQAMASVLFARISCLLLICSH